MATKRLPKLAREDGAARPGIGPEAAAAPVTMADVAKRAGVSIATVSRVVSGHPTVAPEYRDKVRLAIADLTYRPNRLAQNLRRRNTEMVGVVISDIENPHFSEMIHIAEEEAYRRGYRVLLCNTDESAEKQRSYLEMLADERPMGVILASCNSSGPEIGQLIDIGIPIVAFDRPVDDPRADTVLGDNFEASRAAVAHLVERGYTRIGYVSISTAIETGAQRLAGYRAAMAEYGLEARWEEGGLRLTPGLLATERLLAAWPEMQAMVVGNNMMAIGAMKAIREAGRRVPEDIALVAFDDPIWAELMQPSLTTMTQPVRAMTATAVRLLLDNIEGRRREPQRIVFRFTLKVRESSGPGIARSPADALVAEASS